MGSFTLKEGTGRPGTGWVVMSITGEEEEDVSIPVTLEVQT